MDGHQVRLTIYEQELGGVAEFKYLGVTLNSCASLRSHVLARASTFNEASGLLSAGLFRIPGNTLGLGRYLWQALVSLVASYGMELFDWSDEDFKIMHSQQIAGLRRLLNVGGRAPLDSVTVLSSIACCSQDWRVRRVALLLRLLNSPPDSLQHLALATFMMLKSPWLVAALEDMQLVLPGISLRIGTSPYGPIVSSTSRWSDADEWLCAQPWGLPYNDFGIYGRRFRTPTKYHQGRSERAFVRNHIRRITSQLRLTLHRQSNSELLARLAHRDSVDPFAKTALLYARLCCPGPPLHTCLDWIGPPTHRAAVASIFSGDVFLGRYAGNFFAKAFIPLSANHVQDANNLDIEPSRVCISCWHHRRQIVLECEGHVYFECPEYDKARSDLYNEIVKSTLNRIQAQGSGEKKLLSLTTSATPSDWSALGHYAWRVRQARRRIRQRFEDMSAEAKRISYSIKRDTWRARGGRVCRHGVFFTSQQTSDCPCMRAAVNQPGLEIWKHARYMPRLSEDLKMMIITPFDAVHFCRAGQLQAEMKRRNYI